MPYSATNAKSNSYQQIKNIPINYLSTATL
nr:MAG TPA: hypothetical protein [Caudoviricetes sp.]